MFVSENLSHQKMVLTSEQPRDRSSAELELLPALELVADGNSEYFRSKPAAPKKARIQEAAEPECGDGSHQKRMHVLADEECDADFSHLAMKFLGDKKYAPLFAVVNNHLKHVVTKKNVVIVIEKDDQLFIPTENDRTRFDSLFELRKMPSVKTVFA